MANLITQKQKKELSFDYLIRLVSVSLLLISLLGIFLLAYVIPYYLSLKEKDLKVAEQFKSVINSENKENIGESASRIISQTAEELRVIELYSQNRPVPSIYFNKIIVNKNSNIQLSKLSFNLSSTNQGQFLVSGVAKNREGLVSFIEDLKAKGGFTSVESPVSDFAKDKNISFTLNIKIAI
ncbi:MAG: hypothetical protein A2541_00590 [Candidatus Taylorbacteria bacterium RIFOXYD2_FULL_36_9]|uniref:Uncharacterized protein n=1 Tax=Candidatus Taylorbacteria bacterium RIFOXYD2_FULL_36_9 TaxID=1802338 RepID=A0A1G2PFS8_9BACT|nr:MAG: hypothetical protein A2541_00590 [Candidatus Taylorbacteria bacterium RIFOXYD2_FULL_36_9]